MLMRSLQADLDPQGRPCPFVPGDLEMVLAPQAGVTVPSRVVPRAARARLRVTTSRPGGLPTGPVPAYTTNGPLNSVLTGLAVADMVLPAPGLRPER
jgi:hypothetical protein